MSLVYGYTPPPKVPCGLCGLPTIMTGTKRCDRCWELERRIESDPDLARWILARTELGPHEQEENEL